MIHCKIKAIKKLAILLIMVWPLFLTAQEKLQHVLLDKNMRIISFQVNGLEHVYADSMVLFSYDLNGQSFDANNNSRISCTATLIDSTNLVTGLISFRNNSADTLVLGNVLPFIQSKSDAYITGLGQHALSRTYLFLPGKLPVNVIVPDNAWELGYNSIEYAQNEKLVALTRRVGNSLELGQRRRFETVLYPGGSIQYKIYIEHYKGEWQQGLVKVFQQRMLYDIPVFDSNLYMRKDQEWIRHSYVQHLMYAWDKFYYDAAAGGYQLQDFLKRGKRLYGGDDIVSIWPTWPILGMDQRNQFDLFRDLPGGITEMQHQAKLCRAIGTKFFICYNPWDGSTRAEDHFDGLTSLIKSTTADGVVLDTKGSSSKELQDAADRARPGVVMYSEGMAVPRDMNGILSGRVHNALYYPPMLNLNKLIRPSFAIFRVAELYKEKIRREFATSFFNGYGTEINIMAPGQPAWAEEQYRFLGRSARILRENTTNFVTNGLTPLVHVDADSIWVNEWRYEEKHIYTIYSIIPSGYKGNLIEVQPAENRHYVDLWHHTLLNPNKIGPKWFVEAQTDAFNASDLGTNNEGEVDCIAALPVLLRASLQGNDLRIDSKTDGAELRVWAGNPEYDRDPLLLASGHHVIKLDKYFGRYEGKFVVQLFRRGILMDEQIVYLTPGTARRVSAVSLTKRVKALPKGMVAIPAGSFKFKVANGDEFISYPMQDADSSFQMPRYFMDQFPVTNRQFQAFMVSTRYHPTDTANFLKHWPGKKIRRGEEDFPVIYISYEDAKAYAVWAEKRLPTEIEWQYAAQTPSLREWPWDQQNPVSRKSEEVNETLTVTSLEGIDSGVCNLGDGRLYAVGTYPKGANPFGLQDLVGSVWQLTNDQYMSGSYRYIIMKGGSYYKPSSSWWYVQGGPKELYYRQYLLRVSAGFERNATVGFRCVKDAVQ